MGRFPKGCISQVILSLHTVEIPVARHAELLMCLLEGQSINQSINQSILLLFFFLNLQVHTACK